MARTIGKLAGEAGVNVETIRYYQRRGLMREPSRELGSVRRYNDGDLARLQFIRRARLMGFSLEEIQDLLELGGATGCAKTQALTQAKLDEVTQRIDELDRLRSDLQSLLSNCKANPEGAECPALSQLEGSR
ncbi:MAG: MerR family DNA-binding protein [Pseudomonadota bacterium]